MGSGRRRGFRISRRLVRLWRWLCKRRTFRRRGYLHLRKPPREKHRAHQQVVVHKLSGKVLGHNHHQHHLHHPLGYQPLDGPEVPKGYMAVYVGQNDEQYRFLVPVLYVNHPLFAALLRVTEEEYGFEQVGGITIPCDVSHFETVRKRIAGDGWKKLLHRLLHPF
ncbi:hypothetical protein AMTRI_Chr04g246530 [Amborella trichopoda]|uniref:Uncharacterized protein n=1 Tax=Amborella trichopoda TaxID=13333 RepID=W1NJN5_AMBTC|nr:auxin-responsive protein SAUR36 [Amborella trichopoda]ERM95449.1 hypothetical protein AMTR_s00008p00255330 [Amborella trichopoda]|eukprot:XP_006828033.1 auxin-responsive protein SAUR36 [Amborella trichopoda]